MTPSAAQSLGIQLPTGTDLNDPTAVYVSAPLDGGISCLRKTSIDGLCNIDVASGIGRCNLQNIMFNATISPDYNKLTIENSMYLNCISSAVKIDGTSNASTLPLLLSFILGALCTATLFL